MERTRLPLLLAVGLPVYSIASATVTIDTVFVGDADNAEDATGYGRVSYNYRIGTYEVTNSQYTAFLNSTAATDPFSLYHTDMGSNEHGGITRAGSSGNYTYSIKSGFENKPVNYVSFWDAARFANWLTNGQPVGEQGPGTTEDGMYHLGGTTDPSIQSVTRQLDFSLGENGVAVASENEWYKAAYYDGSGGYYLYPAENNATPTAVRPEDATGSNNANYDEIVGTLTDVGAYPNSASHYGTFDQGGNVWEWNDEMKDMSALVVRGGSLDGESSHLSSSFRNAVPPTFVNFNLGFRVSSLAPIPEPSNYGVILGWIGLMLALARRRRRGTL